MMSYFEKDYISSHHSYLAACDEVGRGPLAGPVVAATVICSDLSSLPAVTSYLLELGITDSKKLSAKRRAKLIASLGLAIEDIHCDKIFSLTLKNNLTLKFSLHEISSASIDQINILNASLSAMSSSFSLLASEHLKQEQGVLLVDGNRLPKNLPIEVTPTAIVKGDSKSSLIGLASVLAKEYRDLLMVHFDKMYPGYGLARHAGYGTSEHLEAIKALGPSPIHRKTFKGVREFC